MTRILQVALRDFLATVATKGFVFGLLVVPAILTVLVIVGPRIFDDETYRIAGEYAVIDPTGVVFPELRAALDPEAVARRRREEFARTADRAREVFGGMADAALRQSMDETLGPAPDIRLTALPGDADVETAKGWLNEEPDGPRHAALIVIHEDAVQPAAPGGALGTYDLYVAPGLDDRDPRSSTATSGTPSSTPGSRPCPSTRAAIAALLRVAGKQSTTVSPDSEAPITVRTVSIALCPSPSMPAPNC